MCAAVVGLAAPAHAGPGNDAMAAGDYKRAISILEPPANRGFAEAQYLLGRMRERLLRSVQTLRDARPANRCGSRMRLMWEPSERYYWPRSGAAASRGRPSSRARAAAASTAAAMAAGTPC